MITTKRNPSALETLRKELNYTLAEQMLCVDDYDIVKSFMREKYNILTKKAKNIKEAIEYLESLSRKGEA